MSLTIGSMCTGIGLIDLGLEWAGLGPTKWQCEILLERRAVLDHWWPETIKYTDVNGISNPAWVDIIAFGSPCKNLSSAGDRSGLDGPSSRLFWSCLDVVKRVRPRWVVFENVASGASLWVDRVRDALERVDYKTLPVPISASALGAPHRRARVFIIAHTDRDGESARSEHAEVAGASATPNVEGTRQPRTRGRAGESTAFTRSPRVAWGEPIPDMVRVVHGRADRLDGARQRVAALGDSCVPQCAEVIGHIIRALDESGE